MKKYCSLLITVAGIYILFSTSFILKESRDAVHWPRTKGHIVASYLTIDHLPKFLDWNADPMRWYGVEVHYDYTVKGEFFASHRLSVHSWNTRLAKDAVKVLKKYRRDPYVAVYYDPQDPQQSVLEPGLLGDLFTPLMAGILLTLIGLLLLYRVSIEFDNGADVYLYRGHQFQSMGNFDAALRQYSYAIKLNPKLALAYSTRGNLFLDHRDWDLAIADLIRAIELDPHDSLFYFTLANAYSGKEEYAKALATMNIAVQKGFNVRPEILEEMKWKSGLNS